MDYNVSILVFTVLRLEFEYDQPCHLSAVLCTCNALTLKT